VRPSDWFLVGLPVDPTPGDAFGIRSLAAKYGVIAQIAGEASTGVRHARSSGAASAWVGDAGDVFRDKSERMPGELAKANDSYELVAEALRVWAAAVDDRPASHSRATRQTIPSEPRCSPMLMLVLTSRPSTSRLGALNVT